MATLKLLAIFGLLGAYFRFFVFGAGYEQVDLQAGLLLAFLAVSVWRNGLKGTMQAVWFILPFVMSLILFGAIFQWAELLGRNDWIHDSLIKAVVFPNSFLAVKIGLEAITFRDLVHLPLGAGGRRNAIVLKAVMEKCTPLLHRYRFFMDLTPHFDGRRWSRFQRLCAVIVAAYISIYDQAEKTQALFDHRTRYLRKEK
ncbi:MAG: hypothetical protein RBR38_09790 [Desulfomicrobium apsheronum]|nr:hypothetical protein [Desulfomicrobium apsheronum]